MGITIVGVPLLALLTAGIALIGIGLAQMLWVWPAVLYFWRRGKKETGKGILIIAGLVVLLNATCWGLLAAGKFRIGG